MRSSRTSQLSMASIMCFVRTNQSIVVCISINSDLVFCIYVYNNNKKGAFDDDDISHVENTVDPVRDLDIISHELRLKDIQTVEKRLGTVSVAKRNQDKDINAKCQMEEKFLAHLRDGKDIRAGDWNGKEVLFVY